MLNGQCSMVNGQCSMVNGQWSMVNAQWSMLNGQWSMLNTPTATLPPVAAPHSYQSPASDSCARCTPLPSGGAGGGLPYNSHATSTPHSPEYAQRAVDRTPGSPGYNGTSYGPPRCSRRGCRQPRPTGVANSSRRPRLCSVCHSGTHW